jgi:tyrosine-protein kinase Etk/Wzc
LGLRDYVRILRRRAWVILFVTIAVFLVVVVYSRSLPPSYRTQASIEVTKAIATEGMERWLYYKGHPIETAMRQIRTAACMEAALRELGEITDASTTSEIQSKVSMLLGMMSVSAVANTNIITISVQGPDPAVLQDYVDAICRVYQRLEREWDRRDDDEVITFLEDRIKQYGIRLEAAEAKMIAFKSTNLSRGIGADPAAPKRLRSHLSVEAAKLSDEIAEIKARRGSWDPGELPQFAAIVKQREEVRAKRDEILERFTENHPGAVRYSEELERLDRTINEERTNFESRNRDRIESAIRTREQRLGEVRAQIADIEKALATLPQDQVVYSNLEMELALSKSLYQMFWERLEQQKIVRQSKSGGVNLQGPAPAPGKVYPNERAHQTVGLAMGLLLGVSFAFLLETMDTSIRTIEEIEEFVGVPVLGVAPIIVPEPVEKDDAEPGPGRPLPQSPGAVMHYHPRDPAAEAYRSLASTLEFTFFNEGHRVLLVASATPQEGKTTSVCNIGIALALSGRKTILLDCNLRHPGVTKVFALSGHAGLSEVLGGFVPWRVCAYPTVVENLEVIPTGSLPGQPAELIKSGLPALLRELSMVYGAVIIDSPPVLPVADASIISSMAGGTVLVYSQGRAPRDVLIRAKAKLETAKGRVLGTFLNKVKPEGELGRNYYYYYYAYYPRKTRGGGPDRGGGGRPENGESRQA